MQRSLCLLLVLTGLLSPLTASAQAGGEDWQEELVIKGRAPAGPALWRVSDGDSEVIILGILPVLPKKQVWRTKRMENALKGARQLITPAGSHASAADMTGMVFTKGLKGGKTLKAILPADLYERYQSTAQRAGIKTVDFEHDKPVWAAVRLRREVLQRRRLTDDEPVDTVSSLARRKGVPVKAAGRYKMNKILNDVNGMSEAASQACMRYTLDDIDFDLDRIDRTAAAWAVGDIGTVRANYQGSALEKCLSGTGKGAALMQQSIADTVAATTAALSKPGKTVAVFPLAVLLRKDGALTRLKAKGFTVTSPAD